MNTKVLGGDVHTTGSTNQPQKSVRPKQRIAAGCNFAVRVALPIVDKASKQHQYVIVKNNPTHNEHIGSECGPTKKLFLTLKKPILRLIN